MNVSWKEVRLKHLNLRLPDTKSIDFKVFLIEWPNFTLGLKYSMRSTLGEKLVHSNCFEWLYTDCLL